jgi:cytochrome c553
MTKTQIWLSGFVILFVALFILGRFTKRDEPEKLMTPQSASKQEPQETNPVRLIKDLGCITCHGNDLNGSSMAPALHGLQSAWTRDDLINYLRNPTSYLNSEKFKGYKGKFKNVVMPSYNNTDVKDLGKIADFLLGL